MGRSRATALCLALVLSVSLAGCGGSTHQPKGALRLPSYGPLHAPDPVLASSSGDLFLASLLYSGLVKFSPDLHVIPELAVSIPTISSSGLAYTFTIRRDARFADGHRCTAWDVAYSLARALRVGGANARSALGGIEGAPEVESGDARELSGVEVLHGLSLRIRLTAPDADFLQKLALPVAAVVDRRVVPDRPMNTWPALPAGTGPWIFSGRARDGSVDLVPRPHYYGSLQLHSLVLVPVRDPAAGLSLYRKGGLDVALVPPASVGRFSGHPDFHQSNALSAYYALPLSGDARPLATQLDRDRLVHDVGMGLSALQTVVPPAVPDYVSSPPSLGTASTSDAAAQRVEITVGSPSDRVSLALKRALQQQWSQSPAGNQQPVRVRIVRVAHLMPDPGLWLRVVLPQTRSRWIRSSLRNAAKLTNDPVDRMNIYDQCERYALGKVFVIPLAADSVPYLIRASVQGMQVTPTGLMPDNNNWGSVTLS